MMTLEDIQQAVHFLTVEQRKQLIAFVVESLIDREGQHDLHSILEFEGIAAHQADDEDPQEYVNRLRDEWDKRPPTDEQPSTC